MKASKVISYDVEALAEYILGLPEDTEYPEIEEKLYDEFDCSMETFEKIASHLLPCVFMGKDPIDNEWYRGFSKPEQKSVCRWIIKEAIQ